jgi:hypothetical protein
MDFITPKMSSDLGAAGDFYTPQVSSSPGFGYLAKKPFILTNIFNINIFSNLNLKPI